MHHGWYRRAIISFIPLCYTTYATQEIEVFLQHPFSFPQKEIHHENTCMKTPCKVNYIVQQKKDDTRKPITSKKITCTWDFGFHVEKSNSCNPPILEYPEGTFHTTLRVFSGTTPIYEKQFTVIHMKHPDQTEKKENNTEIFPRIEIQGKRKPLMMLSGNTLTCEGTCTVNFDGRKSHAPRGADFLWNIGNSIFTGKNPPPYSFSSGTHQVTLTISHNNQTKTSSFFIHVLGDARNDSSFEEKETVKPLPIEKRETSKHLEITLSIILGICFGGMGMYLLKRKGIL